VRTAFRRRCVSAHSKGKKKKKKKGLIYLVPIAHPGPDPDVCSENPYEIKLIKGEEGKGAVKRKEKREGKGKKVAGARQCRSDACVSRCPRVAVWAFLKKEKTLEKKKGGERKVRRTMRLYAPKKKNKKKPPPTRGFSFTFFSGSFSSPPPLFWRRCRRRTGRGGGGKNSLAASVVAIVHPRAFPLPIAPVG